MTCALILTDLILNRLGDFRIGVYYFYVPNVYCLLPVSPKKMNSKQYHYHQHVFIVYKIW